MDSSSDSECDCDCDYEVCQMQKSQLPFDPSSLEDIILMIIDKFDFRVVLSDERIQGAMVVTTGLAMAGTMIGRHYGGNIGAAVGGAIGGACGLGIVVVSMRSIWNEVKARLWDLFEIVYDYLSGLGLDDYRKAATVLTSSGSNTQLAMLILQSASGILGKKILSNLSAV